MIIEKIKYSQEFHSPTSGASWIGIEVQPEPGDNPDECYRQAVYKVRDWYWNGIPVSEGERQVIMAQLDSTQRIIDRGHEKLEVAIDNCNTIEELDKLKSDNLVFPAKLIEVFNAKRKQLTK